MRTATVYGRLPAPAPVGMLGKLLNRDSSSGSVPASLGLCMDLHHISVIWSNVNVSDICVCTIVCVYDGLACLATWRVGTAQNSSDCATGRWHLCIGLRCQNYFTGMIACAVVLLRCLKRKKVKMSSAVKLEVFLRRHQRMQNKHHGQAHMNKVLLNAAEFPGEGEETGRRGVGGKGLTWLPA